MRPKEKCIRTYLFASLINLVQIWLLVFRFSFAPLSLSAPPVTVAYEAELKEVQFILSGSVIYFFHTNVKLTEKLRCKRNFSVSRFSELN